MSEESKITYAIRRNAAAAKSGERMKSAAGPNAANQPEQ